MILLEDAVDIQERHFRLHWMLNLAQFQSSLTFESIFVRIVGEMHKALVGRILVSDEDRNWDSVRDSLEAEGGRQGERRDQASLRQRRRRRRHEDAGGFARRS